MNTFLQISWLMNFRILCVSTTNKNKVILNIVSPNIDSSNEIIRDRFGIPTISQECFEYVYISRTYAAVHLMCYMAFMDFYGITSSHNAINQPVSLVITKNLKKMVDLIQQRLFGFIVNNNREFSDFERIFEREYTKLTQALVPTDFVEIEELSYLFEGIATFHYILNRLGSKIMFLGIKAMLRCSKNNNSLNIVKHIRRYQQYQKNRGNKHLIDKYGAERFVALRNVEKFSIKSILKKSGFNPNDPVNFEINITLYIMEIIIKHIRSLNVLYSQTSEIATPTHYELTYIKFRTDLESHFNTITEHIKTFWHNEKDHETTNQIIYNSIYIVFDHLKILHYIKYNYNLKKNDYKDIEQSLNKVCDNVDKLQIFFTKIIKNDNIVIPSCHADISRIEELYLSYYDHYLKLIGACLVFMAENKFDRYLNVANLAKIITFNTIDLCNYSSLNYFVMKERQLEFKTLSITFRQRLDSLSHELQSELNSLSRLGYFLVKNSYVALLRNHLKEYILRITYLPMQSSLLCLNEEERILLRNSLKLRKIIASTKGNCRS